MSIGGQQGALVPTAGCCEGAETKSIIMYGTIALLLMIQLLTDSPTVDDTVLPPVVRRLHRNEPEIFSEIVWPVHSAATGIPPIGALDLLIRTT